MSLLTILSARLSSLQAPARLRRASSAVDPALDVALPWLGATRAGCGGALLVALAAGGCDPGSTDKFGGPDTSADTGTGVLVTEEDCATPSDDDGDGDTNDQDAIGCTSWYVDADDDGVGGQERRCLCLPEDPFDAASGGDCDDHDPAVSPAAAGCRWEGVNTVSEAAWVARGEEAWGAAGIEVTGRCDLNGDGATDVAFSAPRATTSVPTGGAVYIVLGPRSGTATLTARASAVLGVEEDGQLGIVLNGLGDTNSDGYDDLIVGDALSAEIGDASARAWVVLGPASGGSAIDDVGALVQVEGSGPLGDAVSAGDMNLDGEGDLALGAGRWSEEGGVWIVAGPFDDEAETARTTLATFYDDVRYGTGSALDGGADVDGDGTPDLLVAHASATGEAATSGAAWLIPGPVSGVQALADAEMILLGESTNDQLGTQVELAGDLDGDGLRDWVVGAPYALGGGGTTYFVSGTLRGTLTASEASGRIENEAGPTDPTLTHLGGYPEGVGDLDLDGFDDLLVNLQTNIGALLYYGPIRGVLTIEDSDAQFTTDPIPAEGTVVGFLPTALAQGALDDAPSFLFASANDPADTAGAIYAFGPPWE